MKKFLISTVFLLLISATASAEDRDIYVMTEESNQGAVYEYYVQMSTHTYGENEESVRVVRIGIDKWTKRLPPYYQTYWFWKTKDEIFYRVYYDTGKHEGMIGTVKDNELAKRVYEALRETVVFNFDV